MSVMNYISAQQYENYEPQIINILFVYALTVAILIPAFVSLFIGTEYSDGTMRNKIIIGQTRKCIYLSNLIVCSVAGLSFCISYVIGVFIAALPFHTINPDILKDAVMLILCSFVMSIAFTALCALTAMLCQNKALTAVINILTAFCLLVISLYITSRLSQPEVYLGFGLNTETGKVEATEDVPNPSYLRGTEREIYQFFNDFIPTGQAVNITQAGGTAQSPGLLAAYSASIIIVSTGVGMFVFKKKDIK